MKPVTTPSGKPETKLAVSFTKEVRQRFLEYALSVIIARALPNVVDGLKPVHRRILYAMYQLRLTANKPFKKSARIVGEVIGKYHPHGDMAVYDAMVKMIQPFSSYYPLVNGHGNFGSVDGDSPAAMRYTEVRLAPLTETILQDLPYQTVDFISNYDGTEKEPVVFPGLLPNLLLNGSTGIAVGMATNIPPHNLGEVVDGLVAYLKNPKLSPEELKNYIQGPDFPTGCEVILTHKNHLQILTKGRGKFLIRGRYKFEETAQYRQLVFYEIPYQVNKVDLIKAITALVQAGKITEISDLKDESNRFGIRLILRLKKTAQVAILLNKLFVYTNLQTSYSVNLIALHQNQPELMPYLRVFEHYVAHQLNVLIRRTTFLLQTARQRIVILDALTKALARIDAVIATTKKAADPKSAQLALQKLLNINEIQAKAVLEMKLQRLTSLERKNLLDEKDDVAKNIANYQTLLASVPQQKALIIKKLVNLKTRFPQVRRSPVLRYDTYANLDEVDFINHQDILVCVSENNYLKRVNADLFTTQLRGGIGVRGMLLNENDVIKQILLVDTHDKLLFFTDFGRVYALQAYKIPDLGRNAKGTPAQNLIRLQPGEKIRSIVKFDKLEKKDRFFFVTLNGLVKQTLKHHFKNINNKGKIAIKLNPQDNLAHVFLVSADENIILSKTDNQIVRFLAKQVRSTGRAAMGKIGARFSPKQRSFAINGASSAMSDQKLLSVDNYGYGKMTALSNYRLTRPGAKGVIGVKKDRKLFSRAICTTFSVFGDENLLIAKSNGKVIISSLKDTRITKNKSARGVRLVKLERGERITAVSILPAKTTFKK